MYPCNRVSTSHWASSPNRYSRLMKRKKHLDEHQEIWPLLQGLYIVTKEKMTYHELERLDRKEATRADMSGRTQSVGCLCSQCICTYRPSEKVRYFSSACAAPRVRREVRMLPSKAPKFLSGSKSEPESWYSGSSCMLPMSAAT